MIWGVLSPCSLTLKNNDACVWDWGETTKRFQYIQQLRRMMFHRISDSFYQQEIGVRAAADYVARKQKHLVFVSLETYLFWGLRWCRHPSGAFWSLLGSSLLELGPTLHYTFTSEYLENPYVSFLGWLHYHWERRSNPSGSKEMSCTNLDSRRFPRWMWWTASQFRRTRPRWWKPSHQERKIPGKDGFGG